MLSRRSGVCVLLVALGIGLAQFALDIAGWRPDAQIFWFVESTAAVVAALIGVLTLVPFSAGGNITLVFVGAGFAGSAFLEIYPAIGAFAPAALLPPVPDLDGPASWGWLVSRLFLGAMLFLGWLSGTREPRFGVSAEARRAVACWVYGLSAVVVLAACYAAASPIAAYEPKFALNRPVAFAPALVFFALLLAYVSGGRWREDRLERWIMLSLIAGLAADLAVAIYTDAAPGVRPESGLLLRVASYGCVLAGLISVRWPASTDAELQDHLLELERTRDRLELQGVELTNLAEALSVARDAAEHADLTKSRFLANVSHELRTPLNAVIGLSAILREDARSGHLSVSQKEEYLNNINTAGQQLLALVNDIIDLSTTESGNFRLNNVDFDLLEVLEDVTNLVTAKLGGKKVDLWSFVNPGTPVHLTGDPARLRQVLLNLVDNAMKFTDRGSVVIETSVQDENAKGLLYRFEVTDTGIGLPAEARRGLFTSFFQVDSSTTRRFGGTGLGLAICKQLVGLMGGEIGVNSEEGRGSTFWFTVQLRRSLPDALALPHLPDLKNLNVLVIDSIEANRDLLQKQFGCWGISVTPVRDEAAAVEAVQQRAAAGGVFDLALINCLLMEAESAELARRIRAIPGVGPVKLVLVCSAEGFGRAADPTDSPFDAVVVKPVTQSGLFDCLAELFLGVSQEPEHDFPAPETQAALVGRGLRILVVEDNSLNALIVVKILSRVGHEMTVVENGALAIDAVSDGSFDLVLMDIQMPVMDGVEATGRIRALDGDVAQIPIIALTAHTMEGDRESYLAAGMNDYVAKPIVPTELAAAIERQTGVHCNLEPFMPPPPAEREIPQETLDALDQFMDSLDEKSDC